PCAGGRRGERRASSDQRNFSRHMDFDLDRLWRKRVSQHLSPGPPNPKLRGLLGRSQNGYCAVLRPIAGPRMNLPCRPELFFVLQSQYSAYARRVAGRAFQPHAQARFATNIVKEPGLRAVLSNREIDSPVLVIITQRRPALFPIHLHSALLPWPGLQIA